MGARGSEEVSVTELQLLMRSTLTWTVLASGCWQSPRVPHSSRASAPLLSYGGVGFAPLNDWRREPIDVDLPIEDPVTVRDAPEILPQLPPALSASAIYASLRDDGRCEHLSQQDCEYLQASLEILLSKASLAVRALQHEHPDDAWRWRQGETLPLLGSEHSSELEVLLARPLPSLTLATYHEPDNRLCARGLDQVLSVLSAVRTARDLLELRLDAPTVVAALLSEVCPLPTAHARSQAHSRSPIPSPSHRPHPRPGCLTHIATNSSQVCWCAGGRGGGQPGGWQPGGWQPGGGD